MSIIKSNVFSITIYRPIVDLFEQIKTGEMQGEIDESITVEEDYTKLEISNPVIINDYSNEDEQQNVIYEEAMEYKAILDEAKKQLKTKILSILDAGEITSEEESELSQIKDLYTENYTALKELANADNANKDIGLDISNNSNEKINIDEDYDKVINFLIGKTDLIYKDDDGNILINGLSIPKLTMVMNKLDLIVTDGDNESEFQLTPEFMKLITDKIILEAKKIELNGTININDGAFVVGSTGRTRIGGLTGHIINGYDRAQLDISSLGTLYSVSLTTEDLYAQLSEGYIKFVNGNQTSKVTSAGIDTTSDIRLKENVTPIDERYEKLMLDICPIQYNMKDDRENIPKRKNIGFSAQQVESLMSDYGIDYNEFAALNKNKDGIYSLNYNEFIPLNTYMIQALDKRMKILEEKYNANR